MSDYYKSRINKALDFINLNLAEDLRVSELAETAHFSIFHFQRIFKALQNETPYDSILRLRLEKAVSYLKHHPEMKIQDIALTVGFPSAENFNRQFKERFGISPGQLRKDKEKLNSRIYQESPDNIFHLAYDKSRAQGKMTFDIQIEDRPIIEVALIKAVFGADGSELIAAYEQLMAWYESTGNHRTGSRRFGMSIDDPDVTPANKYRYDYAVGIDKAVKTEGVIEPTIIPGGLYAKIHCQGDILKVGQAWDFLYKEWLPSSGYVPRNYPAIEEFLKGPEEIGWEQFDILCLIPIEKITT